MKLLVSALAALVLWFPQADTGSIAGLILTMDGKPAADVRVAATAAESPLTNGSEALLGITRTDDSGHYQIENIPPGRYHIIAGRVDLPTFYPGTAQSTGATEISVIRGSIVKEINFTISAESVRPQLLQNILAPILYIDTFIDPAPPLVQGKVVSESGGVFFSMPSRIVVNTKGTGGSTNTVVHADGTFTLPLGWGEHNIALELPSGYSVVSISLDSVNLLSQPIRLEPRTPFGTIHITLRTPHLKAIRGRVAVESAGTPITGATIVLKDSSGNRAQASSSADGSFEFLGANPGSYSIDISLPYYVSLHQTIVMEDQDLNLDLQISQP